MLGAPDMCNTRVFNRLEEASGFVNYKVEIQTAYNRLYFEFPL
jgi:hypothetical protein